MCWRILDESNVITTESSFKAPFDDVDTDNEDNGKNEDNRNEDPSIFDGDTDNEGLYDFDTDNEDNKNNEDDKMDDEGDEERTGKRGQQSLSNEKKVLKVEKMKVLSIRHAILMGVFTNVDDPIFLELLRSIKLTFITSM